MRPRRPVLLRTVGYLTLGGLLAFNGWLLLLNLAKQDRLPIEFERVPGVAAAAESGRAERADGGDGAAEDLSAGDGETAAFNTDASVVADESPVGTIEVDQWPGGRGPVPDGQAERRQVRIMADGQVVISGSAPEWSVVTGLVDAVAGRLGLDPSTIGVDVAWHPDASPRVGDGEVVLGEPLVYPPGQIELPPGGVESLTPVAELLAANPDLYVVVVGLVDDGETSDEVAAVALGRTSVVGEVFAGLGIEADRVVTSVAPAGPADGSGEVGSAGDRVLVRIENLLVVGPAG